jgi:hypothetical protein
MGRWGEWADAEEQRSRAHRDGGVIDSVASALPLLRRPLLRVAPSSSPRPSSLLPASGGSPEETSRLVRPMVQAFQTR